MIERLAEKLALMIKKENHNETANVEVLRFSLILLMNIVSIILFSLIIGMFTGKLVGTGIALFSFALLRSVSGGYHLKSSDVCVLASVASATLIPHLPIRENWLPVLTTISLVILILRAPAGIKDKTRIPERFFPALKIISILIVASNFMIGSSAMALAFLLQAVSLLFVRKEVSI